MIDFAHNLHVKVLKLNPATLTKSCESPQAQSCESPQAQSSNPHKILNFFSEHNIAIPSSRRKLTIKSMLEKLRELKVRVVPAEGEN